MYLTGPRIGAIKRAYKAEPNAFKLGCSKETMARVFNEAFGSYTHRIYTPNEVRELLDLMVEEGHMVKVARPGEYTRFFIKGDEPVSDEKIREELDQTPDEQYSVLISGRSPNSTSAGSDLAGGREVIRKMAERCSGSDGLWRISVS